MLRLKKVVIHRYRSVPPGTRLEFSDGINAILGQNGSGKTTLLNLIVMILRGDFSALKEEADGAEFEFTTVTEQSGVQPGQFETWMRIGVAPMPAPETPAGWGGAPTPAGYRWEAEGRYRRLTGPAEPEVTFRIASDAAGQFSPELADDVLSTWGRLHPRSSQRS